MRVMGVDPGLARCGVAVIDGDVRRSSLTAHELIRTGADDDAAQRLAVVHDRVAGLIGRWRPDVLAMERLLFNANAASAMAVAQSVGVILLAAAHAELAVSHYTPTQVKATVTGHGGADKAQVGYLVTAQLGLTAPLPGSPDVADAAAVALCHLWRGGSVAGATAQIGGHSSRLAAAVAAAGPGAQVVQRGSGGSRRAGGGDPS